MTEQGATKARRAEVTEPIAIARQHDYADAFEVDLPEPDGHPPEAWVRAGFDATPRVVAWLVGLLGADTSDSDQLGGWDVVESGPDVIHLEQSLALMHVVFVGRNVEPTRRMLTTALTYHRPVLGRLAWSVIGIAHRRTARRLIMATVPAPSTPRDVDGVRGT